MKRGQGFKGKNYLKRWWVILIIGIVIILIFSSIINIMTRERLFLTEEQKDYLLEIYPEELLDGVNIYYGGVLTFGSSKVFFDSIYISKKDYPRFLSDPLANENMNLLVHEIFHEFQVRKITYPYLALNSLLNQFISFVNYGSRNYAYYYSINQQLDSFNVEQEAALIEDYFSLDYIRSCYDCKNKSNEEILIYHETATKYLFEKYS